MSQSAVALPAPGARGRTLLISSICVLSVIAAGLILPGAGLVLALIFAFTILRGNRLATVVAIGVGAILTVLAVSVFAPTTEHHSSTISVVQQ